jgi:hypothetical protein
LGDLANLPMQSSYRQRWPFERQSLENLLEVSGYSPPLKKSAPKPKNSVPKKPKWLRSCGGVQL